MLAVALLLSTPPAFAQDSGEKPGAAAEPQDMVIEIYRIAPGKHRAFLEAIASYDEVNRRAGLPPRQLFVHQTGAQWDFLLLQPARNPEDKRDALDAAWEELGLLSGPDFFFSFRSMVAEHTDTFVSGPTTAAAYLAKSKSGED
jgi:hypothetical protein